ncbi:MAG: FAD-dependent oxidoreductase [Polyangiaceae bacterium]|nr:FAD-dependent oxidoreductase [Polyangiaceae bacterium]
MTQLDDAARLELVPDAQLVVAADGRLLVRSSAQTVSVEGVEPELLRALVGLVGERAVVSAVLAGLPAEASVSAAREVLTTLSGLLWRSVESPGASAHEASLLVIGSGSVAAAITRRMTSEGYTRLQTLPAAHAASASASALGTHHLVVVALEAEQHDVNLQLGATAMEASVPVLFVTVEDGGIHVGPVQIAGVTACYACERVGRLVQAPASEPGALATLGRFHLGALRARDVLLVECAADLVVATVSGLLSPTGDTSLFSTRVRVDSAGQRAREFAVREPGCAACSTRVAGDRPLDRRAAVAVTMGLDRQAASLQGGEFIDGDGYRSVGILGGGTAGYLAALALRARRPDLDVTLIESSRIPILGVGEATTPLLVEFLHQPDRLGRDVIDFYRRVQPTWKLGIAFYWGLPGAYRFEFPFEFGSVVEPVHYQGNIDAYCLGAVLQASDTTPIFDLGNGQYQSLLGQVPYAYHLDNRRFVQYLKEEALAAGVTLLDREIADARLSEDGSEIARLVSTEGESFVFDLYLDCSGFRSFLLEKKLGSPWLSYASSLFNDSAVMANVPNRGRVKPYTLAESMDHGWCWNIPFEDADHRGYVFSSQFASLDQATDELMRKNPGATEPWSLKFRSGRHADFFKGNVVALGNAYAFVEPLESTAIHMLIYELQLLLDHLPARKRDSATQRAMSAKMNELWDNLRGFLAVHFRFNHKFDTPYWRACQSDAELGTAEQRVALFRERAPLRRSSYLLGGADPFFGSRSAADFFTQEYVYDVLLAGQQVPARWAAPVVSREAFTERQRLMRRAAERALPQARALALLRERPELLGLGPTSR